MTRGRPPKDPADRRTVRLVVKLTVEEAAQLLAASARLKSDVSKIVRSALRHVGVLGTLSKTKTKTKTEGE